MKKIVLGLLLSLCLIFSNQIGVRATISDFQLKDFYARVTITPTRNDTEIDMSWTTEKEMTSLVIEVLLDDGTTQHPINWSLTDGKYNENWKPPHEPSSDGKYHYELSITVESGKFGIIYLDWQYTIDNQTYQHPVYLSTGNPNVNEEYYSPSAAFLIGLVATIGAALGTYLIYLISQKDIFNEEEEEDEIS